MRTITILFAFIAGCTLKPDIDVEVPEGAIANETAINVEMKEFLKEAIASQQQKPCDFATLPDNDEGKVVECYGNCCLWSYYGDFCVERWCLQLDNTCGWELHDWNCDAPPEEHGGRG